MSAWKAKLKPYHLKLFFSNKYSYAQIVRSEDGHIVAAASTLEKALRENLPKTGDKQAAGEVGKLLAERARAQEVPSVHWARKHGQKYHGKIKAVIESMKEAGLPLG